MNWDSYISRRVQLSPEHWRESLEHGAIWKRAIDAAEIVNRNLQGNAAHVTAANARRFEL